MWWSQTGERAGREPRWAFQRRRHRRSVLLICCLLGALAAWAPAGGSVLSGLVALAGPCDPTPPRECLPDGTGCTTIPQIPPNSGDGGGGDYCRENPSDPRCQGSTRAPTLPATGARARQVVTFFVGGVAAAAPGDSPCNQNPAPPPPAPPPTPTPIPVNAGAEAPRILAAMQVPSVEVKANPALGLVNLPTWFWAVGYDGRPLTAARSWSAPYVPTTVVVTLTVDHYTWNWGDGGQIDTESLGQPYPAESDIQNVYRWSSRGEPGGDFHGSLTVHWRGSYTVNGGAPIPLTGMERRYEFVYPVQQVQPVIRPNGVP